MLCFSFQNEATLSAQLANFVTCLICFWGTLIFLLFNDFSRKSEKKIQLILITVKQRQNLYFRQQKFQEFTSSLKQESGLETMTQLHCRDHCFSCYNLVKENQNLQHSDVYHISWRISKNYPFPHPMFSISHVLGQKIKTWAVGTGMTTPSGASCCWRLYQGEFWLSAWLSFKFALNMVQLAEKSWDNRVRKLATGELST